MILYTYQIGQWRKLQNCGVPLLDTTVKSGDVRLAPTWPMVLGWKAKQISDAEYTQAYLKILDYWWFQDPAFFDDLLAQPQLAIGCYCKKGGFCHRYLLAEFLQRVANVDYRGELDG